MKRCIIFSLITLLLCQVLSAQTYHFQYSHDTLGNRVSRVYQGTNPSKGNVSGTVKGSPANQVWIQEDGDEDRDPAEWSSNQYSEKDTVKISPFIKTQAEKDAYQDSMMAEVMKLQPLPVGRDTRDMTDYSVGAIPLEYGVSGSGARTYSVPIFTAPDIKYAPSISLAYNSQGGYGYGSYGWDLAGLSAITLVSKSKYWDNEIKAASSRDTSGVFCLDGVRLVTNDDEATAASYPLVTATGHVLVAPHRNSRRYIISFTVLYPDGTTAIYGTAEDRGFTMPVYPVTRTTNREGEKIEYSYTYDSQDSLAVRPAIDWIRYGFNSAGQATASIGFGKVYHYSIYNYYAGKKIARSPQITSIVSFSGNQTLYTYSLSYQTQADTDLLKSIALTNHNGEQLPPLSFTYGADSPPHTGPDSLKVTHTIPVSTDDPFSCMDGFIVRRGKFVKGSHNDGLIAFANRKTYKQTGTYKYEYAYPSDLDIAFVASVSDNLSWTSETVGEGFITAEAVDIDGDGIDEVVRVRSSTATPYASGTYLFIETFLNDDGELVEDNYYNVGLSGIIENNGYYSPYKRALRWGDYLGTGTSQLLVVSYSDNGYNVSQDTYISLIDFSAENCRLFEEGSNSIRIASNEDKRLLCMDIDGDGRTEMCVATSDGLVSYRVHQYGIDSLTTYQIPQNVINSDCVYYSDINADGYIDIIQSTSPGYDWTIRINTGLRFEQKTLSPCYASDSSQFMLMDMNRDGYPDLVEIKNNILGFYKNINGMSFSSTKTANIGVTNMGYLLPPNTMDNTAMSSFVTINEDYIREYSLTSYVPPLRHLVQSRDSYGKIVRNTYGYLPQSSLYWTGNTSVSAADGYQLRVLPIYVLTGAKGFMSETATTPSGLQESYSWYDGVVHTRGLGFCGFAMTQTVSNLEVNLKKVSTFNPQKRGVPVSVTLYSGFVPPYAYSTTTYTYDNHFTQFGKLQPRLTQTAVTKSIDGVLSNTSYTYDNFDFPIKVVTTKSGGTFTSCPSVVLTEYTHSNNPSRYVLGVVASQTTLSSKTLSTNSAMGTQKVFTYDTLFRPVRCETYRVTSSVPAHVTTPNYWTLYHASTDRWQYDSHGNVIREESAPSGAFVFVGTSYTYDNSGRHLISSTDALGHTSTYSGFNHYGNPSIVTNHKGQQTHSYRDGWGRVTRTVHPDGTVDSLARAWGGSGVYKETSISSGAPDVVVDYDAAGREVLSQNKRFNGQWQKVATQYNKRGLTYKVSLPYRGSSASYWSTYLYDSYGRLVSITEPSGRKTTRQYSGTTVTETKDKIKVIRKTDLNGALYTVSDSLGTYTYSYRDDGQPASISSPSGVLTTFTYDTLGRRTSITDPSAGTRNTAYSINANGSSSITETNALGSITTGKDSLGRVISIVRPDFNTTFTYDTCGRLVSKVSTNGTAERYTYDAYDRLLTAKDSVPDGKWLQKAYYYDAYGRLSSLSYTNQNGYITSELYYYTNGHNYKTTMPDGTVIYQLTAENDLGQPTSALSGSAYRTYGYTAYGTPTFRKLGNGSLLDFRYTFNETTGNLTNRSRYTSGSLSTSENFTYDNLGRLTGAGGSTISYDADNNITSMGGVGTMSYYGDVHPYTVTGLDEQSTDATGTSSQTYTYKAYDRPATISQGNITVTYTYNSDYDRVKMVMYQSGFSNLSVKHYVGDQYETEWDPVYEHETQLLYLGGDAYSAPMVLKKADSGNWTPYVIGRDHLGSITHIATTNGTLVEERSYNAWGRLRNPSTNAVYSASSQLSLFLGRGWCGHEYIKYFGLINMNARLYDPILGRFLSPDPYIQAPDIPGNFNRYAYCLNNPLKYNDRTGEVFGIDDALLSIIAGAFIGAYTGGVLANYGQFNPTKWDFKNGRTIPYILSGTAFGAFSSYVGCTIAASGKPFANTFSIIESSSINSAGMYSYTSGQIPFSVNLGGASYDFTNQEWNYLWKKGNSTIQNVGYSLGALANLSDLLLGFKPSGVDLVTEKEGAIGHSAIVKERTETGQPGMPDPSSLISVGPDRHNVPEGSWHWMRGTNHWDSHSRSGEAISRLNLKVNINTIEHYSQLLDDLSDSGRLIYSAELSSCVTHTSIALNLSGVFNIGIHPYLLSSQMYLWSLGFRPWTYCHYLIL